MSNLSNDNGLSSEVLSSLLAASTGNVNRNVNVNVNNDVGDILAQRKALLRALTGNAHSVQRRGSQVQVQMQVAAPPAQRPAIQRSNSGANEFLLNSVLQTAAAQAAAPAQRGVSRNNSSTLSDALNAITAAAPATNNETALRALLLLQQARQQPSTAPPAPAAAPQQQQLTDLQNQLRLRQLETAGLLNSNSVSQPTRQPAGSTTGTTTTSASGSTISRLDLLRLRTDSILNAPARSGSDLLEQARIIQAFNTHQQALATANEAERRLNALLQGGSATIASTSTTAPTPAASSQPTSVASAAMVVDTVIPNPAAAAATATTTTTNEDDARKLAALEELSKPTKCVPCLPPVEEGNTPHYSQRVIVPLGMQEDPNWLSERQCFIRSELLEVVRASHEEVLVRSSSKSIAYQQVGIRCRYCAHLPTGSRAIRASAFPSSIRQMYQSFTMMVRDHFGNCVGVPKEKKQRFLKLKGLTSPSSSLSRQYWAFAAKKLGMQDSKFGIMINDETQAEAAKIAPFGTSPQETRAIQASRVELLVQDNDQNGISAYLYFLMSQAQVVQLLPSERVGKRKDAAVGLPGFGCKYCATSGRLGFCRMFPLNKRSLPDKVNDLYNHMMRCPDCPRMTKRLLESRRTEQDTNRIFAERDRDFIDRIWIKLGRDCDEAFKKA